MIVDYFSLAGKGLMSRRMRTVLTIIGIFIGIAAVVSLISLGGGMQNAVNEQFQKIGSNRIAIMPKGAIAGPMSGDMSIVKLTEKDVDVVLGVQGVEFAIGVYITSERVTFKEETKQLTIAGMDTDTTTTKFIEDHGQYDLMEGRNAQNGEKYVAAIGYSVANDNFDRIIRLGNRIIIKEIEFKVIGIQKKTGLGPDGFIRIPKDTLREFVDKTNEVTSIFVVVKDDFDPEEVAEDIKKALRKSRDVEEDKEDFSVETAQNIINSFMGIIAGIQGLLVGIASISLLVGGVGIMSTMYTAVVQRTRDIGVMKAVGASDRDILILFLIESGLLGMAGGLMGVLAGAGIAKTIEFVAVYMLGSAILKVYITPSLIAFSLLFSFTVGVISGLFPARNAARMKPVEALRYE